MQKVSGTMTNAAIKPVTKDKEGFTKTPSYLSLTFKIELGEFTEAELGSLLITAANGDEVSVGIAFKQMLMEAPE